MEPRETFAKRGIDCGADAHATCDGTEWRHDKKHKRWRAKSPARVPVPSMQTASWISHNHAVRAAPQHSTISLVPRFPDIRSRAAAAAPKYGRKCKDRTCGSAHRLRRCPLCPCRHQPIPRTLMCGSRLHRSHPRPDYRACDSDTTLQHHQCGRLALSGPPRQPTGFRSL